MAMQSSPGLVQGTSFPGGKAWSWYFWWGIWRTTHCWWVYSHQRWTWIMDSQQFSLMKLWFCDLLVWYQIIFKIIFELFDSCKFSWGEIVEMLPWESDKPERWLRSQKRLWLSWFVSASQMKLFSYSSHWISYNDSWWWGRF